MSTPTPRTDAQEWTETNRSNAVVLASFARTLEREVAAERAIVSRIWVKLGSPTYKQLKGRSIYDLIDEMRADLAIEREKSERYRLASLKLDAELATERARMDWLECHGWITGEPCDRASIDAAMKEETK